MVEAPYRYRILDRGKGSRDPRCDEFLGSRGPFEFVGH